MTPLYHRVIALTITLGLLGPIFKVCTPTIPPLAYNLNSTSHSFYSHLATLLCSLSRTPDKSLLLNSSADTFMVEFSLASAMTSRFILGLRRGAIESANGHPTSNGDVGSLKFVSSMASSFVHTDE